MRREKLEIGLPALFYGRGREFSNREPMLRNTISWCQTLAWAELEHSRSAPIEEREGSPMLVRGSECFREVGRSNIDG